ncbi:MAG: hypothetical protein ABI625_14760 [bacterium]
MSALDDGIVAEVIIEVGGEHVERKTPPALGGYHSRILPAKILVLVDVDVVPTIRLWTFAER